MGATVLCGKRAAYANGVYALFEKTYEANCTPHTPHWGCIAVGSCSMVLSRIFQSAAVCEGGLLRSPAGSIKPENYIASWVRAIAAPVELCDSTMTLKAGTSIYATIPQEVSDEALAVLQNLGKTDILGKPVSVLDNLDVLEELYGGNGFIAPWRVLGVSNMGIEPQKAMVAIPDVPGEAMPIFEAYRLYGDNLAVNFGNGAWHLFRSSWSAVAHFIQGDGYVIGATSIKQAKQAIRLLRLLCETAPPMPGSAVLRISDPQSDTPAAKCLAVYLAEIGAPFKNGFSEVRVAQLLIRASGDWPLFAVPLTVSMGVPLKT